MPQRKTPATTCSASRGVQASGFATTDFSQGKIGAEITP
jgi:hypothetical protein